MPFPSLATAAAANDAQKADGGWLTTSQIVIAIVAALLGGILGNLLNIGGTGWKLGRSFIFITLGTDDGPKRLMGIIKKEVKDKPSELMEIVVNELKKDPDALMTIVEGELKKKPDAVAQIVRDEMVRAAVKQRAEEATNEVLRQLRQIRPAVDVKQNAPAFESTEIARELAPEPALQAPDAIKIFVKELAAEVARQLRGK